MTMFDTVLVANRGEIAVRVIRSLRAAGIRAVAVHSDADADARHVREADTAARIGPEAASESYLSADRIVDAARRVSAQAVHPGYGFLAENAAFATACAEAGLTFIGPSAAAIDLMGDKIRAKRTVSEAGVPVVPGSSGDGLTDEELAAAARDIGMPVLLKPSAGGGGKGMRLVRDAEWLTDEIAAARREARGSFGDDTLLVERWIDSPRHIEIQVLADGHGHVIHLGERECSLQRRHQKIIEEAPSPLLNEATRAAMGQAAVNAARSCGYQGAGTVEFIVPGGEGVGVTSGHGQREYYFMEMNTRLQVEHPVTELVTGLDLVDWQVRIAAGEPLRLEQGNVHLSGHAVEARVCAETARLSGQERVDFLPSSGTVRLLREPQGTGVRTDSGLRQGGEVGMAYDPMLAKVIAHGPDRASALRRLHRALAETTVLGVDTNIAFLRTLLRHPDVASGEMDTGLVDREAPGLVATEIPIRTYAAAALLRQATLEPAGPTAPPSAPAGWIDPFSVPTGWRLGGEHAWTVHHLRVSGHEPVAVRVRGLARDAEVRVGDSPPVRGRLARGGGSEADDSVLLVWDGITHHFSHAPDDDGRWLGQDGQAWQVRDHDPVEASLRGATGAHGADTLTAPMPGTVTVVKATVGEEVTAGQSLLVVEAMKMEHVIASPYDGIVTELDVASGSTVAMDQVLAVVERKETEEA